MTEAREINEIQALIRSELDPTSEYFVLYLDDEPELLELFSEVVASFGLKTFATSSHTEALEFIRARSHQLLLIVSDIQMPMIDGFAFRELARPLSKQIPFAILSAHIDKSMALKGIDLKICGFIDKPWDYGKLADLIKTEVVARIGNLKEEAELKQGFISETEELVEQSEELVLKLEQEPGDLDSLNRLFGMIHTVKGASSFFEPKTLQQFAHKFEELLKLIQHGELSPTPQVVSTLFRGVDKIKALIGEFRSGAHQEHDLDAMVKEELTVGPGATANPTPQASAPERKHNEIKVAIPLLDEFMQMSGEMTVIRNMLNKCVRSIEKQYSGDKDVGMLVELLEELHKINGGVQSKITELRKVPVRNILKPLPRAVRDVSQALAKEVRLDIVGDDVRVDTSIAEVLTNSLLHIVKNSIDHGLETPAERVASGKPAQGRVSVSSRIRSEQVIVEIQDDGRGLNLDAIGSKLLKNGTHTRPEIDRMKPEELYLMIFEPGFSTAQVVTDISGRGVGMSMVKSSVESVGGKISIESTAGKGARFTLTLPVPKSVLITKCLFFRAGGALFSLPEEDVIRVFQATDDSRSGVLRELEGGSCALVDGALVPVIELDGVLGLPRAEAGGELNLIIVQSPNHAGKRLALRVDAVLDSEDTVIKAIHPQINPFALYRGATFLDDGTIGLILSTTGIFERSNLERAEFAAKKTEMREAGVESTPVVLVELAGPALYAFPQSAVFRIEEIAAETTTFAAGAWVVPYRNQVLRLVDLQSRFEAPGNVCERPKGQLSVVVVENDARLAGVVVRSIVDIAALGAISTDRASHEEAILGHAFHIEEGRERMVTLLNLEQVMRDRQEPS